MKLSTPSFRGMAPRLTPRALPENASQQAINARLLTGDLQSWHRPSLNHALPPAYAPYQSIFKLNDVWLAWAEHVDAARGTILGDTTYRTYITGPEVYAQPRFTDYAMATSGPEPYPFETRPLGVIGPDTAPTLDVGVDSTPTTFSVDVLDEGDALATEWVISPPGSGSGTFSLVEQDATTGDPAPSYKFTYDEVHNDRQQAYMYRNFGVATAQVILTSFDFQFGGDLGVLQAGHIIGADSSGNGVMVAVDVGNTLKIMSSTSWNFYGASVAGTISTPALAGSIWYRLETKVLANTDLTLTVTTSLYEGTGLLATVTATVNTSRGDYCGFVNANGGDASPRYITWYDNLHVEASGQTGVTIINLATNYVYTFVNDLSQESAPSPASVTIQRPDGVSVTVTTPTTAPTGEDYGIQTKRIYRAATGSLGSVYRFVAEIPLAQADYVDVLTDSQLGEELQTTDWDLPPDDLRFILALPNGIMVGASGNQLCFSAQNYPHAWPISYRLATDTEITGLGNVDTSVMIGTKSFVYTASGNDPASYSMSKPGAPHACASHRSIAYLLRIGVVFAGPDGLMAVNGPTDVVNLTESIFTREQWQALRPETVIGRAHDDVYFFFYGDPENPSDTHGGYALDMKPQGFGLIELGMHASAMAIEFEEDQLVLCLTAYDEPSSYDLPLPTGIDVDPTGANLYDWDAGADLMRYSWTGKLWLTSYPHSWPWVRVRAEDYDELEIEFSTEAGVLMTKLVTSDRAFRIPVRSAYNELAWRVLGTSRVRTVEIADDIEELL